MYGLVNRAVEELLRARYGEDTWLRVKQSAGVTAPQFVSMEPYPDELTVALVSAASAEVGVPGHELLEALGRYWITYTADQGYGELLQMGGKDVKQFLLNLDALHARVGSRFEALSPPSFRVSDVAGDRLLLHYHSQRTGLAPLVIGLLHGLGERFSQTVEVEHRGRRGEQGLEHDVFSLRISPPAAP